MLKRINSAERVKHQWLILAGVVLLGIAVRFYGVNLPLVDSHQVRQAQTAMMTRNLYEDNMNIFCTRLDFFGNIPGYIIMEFPLMHGITALLYYLFGVHEVIGRLVSILFSVGAMFFMYGLARQFLPKISAFAALVLYTFSPMNIFFSRAFMLESSMMFFMVGAVYLFLKWLAKRTLMLYTAALIFASFACLIKPTAAVILAPIATTWFIKEKWNLFKRFDFWLYIFLTITPTIIWAIYAYCFNKMNKCDYAGFGGNWIQLITLRGFMDLWIAPKFYAFVGGSIMFLLLTPLGFLGSFFGFLHIEDKNQRKILYLWLAAIIFYFYIFSGANSGHIYYHLPLLPLAAIFFGFFVEWLMNKRSIIKGLFKRSLFVWLGIGIFVPAFLFYGLGYLKYFQYMYENRMPYTLEAAEIVKKQASENSFVIVAQNGLLLSVFSYYSHSRSWYFTVRGKAIEELEYWRSKGATTFVALDTNYEKDVVLRAKENEVFWRYLNENYRPLAVSEHYFIFDLRNPLK